MKYSILDVHLAFFLLKYDKSNPNWIKPHWNCHKYQTVYTPISLRKDFPHNQHPTIWGKFDQGMSVLDW